MSSAAEPAQAESPQRASGGGVRALAMKGAFWTVFAFGASQIIRFASNVLLTRLLAPELFGLMVLVNVVVQGIELFSDVGVRPSVVRSPRGDDPAFLDTAWTLQAARGLVVWIVACALTMPMASFYEAPQLLWLLPVVSLSSVLSGLFSMRMIGLDRSMNVRLTSLIQLGSQIGAAAVMIAWAWVAPSVWALAAGTLFGAIVRLVWSHSLRGRRDRFRWERDAVRELFGFGQWVFLSTALTFLGKQLDRPILASLIPLQTLGVFGIAIALAEIPERLLQVLAGRVIFPAMSRMLDRPVEQLRATIVRARRWPLVAFSVGAGLACTFGDFPVLWIYDERYAQAAWMVPVLAVGSWIKSLTITIDPYLIAIGKPWYAARANAVRLVVNVAFIPIGFALFGLPGAIAAVSLRAMTYYVMIQFGLLREGMSVLRQDLAMVTVLLVTIAGAGFVRVWFGLGTSLASMPLGATG